MKINEYFKAEKISNILIEGMIDINIPIYFILNVVNISTYYEVLDKILGVRVTIASEIIRKH